MFKHFSILNPDIASQIVGIIGLVSNGLSMLIFYRQRVHKIFHNLLLTLAIFDTASSSWSELETTWFNGITTGRFDRQIDIDRFRSP